MQEEHPEMSICDPLAPRSLLAVGRKTPTGAPASLNVLKKERDIAVTAEPESTRKSTAWSPIHPSKNQWPVPDICIIFASVWWLSTASDQSTDLPTGRVVV